MSPALDRIHGGAGDATLIDFSVSLNPLGPPPQALGAYRQAIATLDRYPEPYAASLCAALARCLELPAEAIVAGNGSTALLYLIARVLNPRRAVVVAPTFSEIANGLALAGHPARWLPLHESAGFALSPAQIVSALEQGADAIFIGRPNSPTGSCLTLDEVREIARQCQARECWCVFDEAFIEFADEPRSAASLIGDYPRLLVVRSMTKIYAIAGLRLGYVAAGAAVARALREALEPWAASGPAAAVGLACLELPAAWYEEVGREVRVERAYLSAELAAVGSITSFPSSANFLLIRAPLAPEGAGLADYLRLRGILIRDLTTMAGAGPGLYRIGLRRRPDHDRLLAVVRQWRAG